MIRARKVFLVYASKIDSDVPFATQVTRADLGVFSLLCPNINKLVLGDSPVLGKNVLYGPEYNELGVLAVLQLLPDLRILHWHSDNPDDLPVISNVSVLTQLTRLFIGVTSLNEAQAGHLATSLAAINGLLVLQLDADTDIANVSYSSFSALSSLTCLTRLSLGLQEGPSPVLPRLIATSCVRLVELELSCSDIETAADLGLLLRMPSLTKLTLSSVSLPGAVGIARNSGLHLVSRTIKWDTVLVLLPLVGKLTYRDCVLNPAQVKQLILAQLQSHGAAVGTTIVHE